MTAMASRWREASAPAKFRLYVQLTLLGAIVSVTIFAAATTADVLWASAGIVVSGLAAMSALLEQSDLFDRSGLATGSWALPGGAAILVLIWTIGAVLARVSTDPSDVDALRATGISAAVLASASIVPFLRYRWWIALGIGASTGAAFGASPAAAVSLAGVTVLVAAVLLSSTLLTRWGLHVVDELERTKTVEARLQVAEERLRFARDLHDVVGRSFSAIAVKSELAATLSRTGASTRAEAEMDEVKTVAVESMDRMRDLVRGYRDIDLGGEVDGARSLLAAAGCRLDIEGEPSRIPKRFHEVSAWVVREGTTNIVKHSTATSATMTLGGDGMSLRNNGVQPSPDPVRDPLQQNGLRGLSERLAQVGADIRASASCGEFVLEVRWETS